MFLSMKCWGIMRIQRVFHCLLHNKFPGLLWDILLGKLFMEEESLMIMTEECWCATWRSTFVIFYSILFSIFTFLQTTLSNTKYLMQSIDPILLINPMVCLSQIHQMFLGSIQVQRSVILPMPWKIRYLGSTKQSGYLPLRKLSFCRN